MARAYDRFVSFREQAMRQFAKANIGGFVFLQVVPNKERMQARVFAHPADYPKTTKAADIAALVYTLLRDGSPGLVILAEAKGRRGREADRAGALAGAQLWGMYLLGSAQVRSFFVGERAHKFLVFGTVVGDEVSLEPDAAERFVRDFFGKEEG